MIPLYTPPPTYSTETKMHNGFPYAVVTTTEYDGSTLVRFDSNCSSFKTEPEVIEFINSLTSIYA
jgi:hypothetical protein